MHFVCVQVLLLGLLMMPLAHCFRIRSRFVSLAQAKAKLQGRTRPLMSLYQSNTYSVKAAQQTVNKPLVTTIYVDKDIAQSLSIRKSKTKQYISNDGYHHHTIVGLRERIEHCFKDLQGAPYKLRYRISRGNMKVKHDPPKQFESDEDLNAVLRESYSLDLPLHLFVQPNPGVFPVGATRSHDLLEDPLESDTFTMLSFYCFYNIEDPDAVVRQLNSLWSRFHALGRVYVAREGVNAQMAVPTNVLDAFQKATLGLPLFEGVKLNTDHRITSQEFVETQPFKQLHVRVREQIVTDGLNSPLDWANKGAELPPLEWHRRLQAIDSEEVEDQKKKTIVLDCRNNYESDVGIFNHAIPLNTSLFKESWTALDEVLKDADKDTPIMAYCTGGIRCVKVGAYLQQTLGFTNVSSLKGGIIAYTRELEQLNNSTPKAEEGEGSSASAPSVHLSRHVPTSLFKGVNYVFDERLGARVTEDVLAQCETCGESCDAYTNCQNPVCNIRFIQCSTCRPAYSGCCSKSCQVEYERKAKETSEFYNSVNAKYNQKLNRKNQTVPQPTPKAEVKLHASSASETLEALGSYADRYSSAEPELLQSLRADTISTYSETIARMLSGHLQGRLLTMLMQMTRARRVLELGAFTGYSTLCFAEGLTAGGKVISCEPDETSRNLAYKYIEQSGMSDKIDLRNAKAVELIDAVRNEGESFDFVFIDADKKNYRSYLQSILGETVTGSENQEGNPLPQRCLLNPGAIIMVDNTLWKGLVLSKTDDLTAFAPRPQEFGDKARMVKMTDWIHHFNEFVAGHPQLETVLIPMRDGLTLIRYKGP